MKNDTINAAIATVNKAQIELKNQIDEAVNKERAYANEIEALRTMPISLDDFSQYLKKHIEFFANEWFIGRSPDRLLKARFAGETAMNKHGWKHFEINPGEVKSTEFFMPDFCTLENGSVFGALCFAIPEMMHEKLMAAYRGAIGDLWGNEEYPTVEQRRTRFAELREKIDTSMMYRIRLQTSFKELFGSFSGAATGTVTNDPNGSEKAVKSPLVLKGQRLANPEMVSSR